jgi:predicted permease
MFRRRKQDDFSEELKSHLAFETEHLREQGLPETEARRVAHLNIGNLMNHEERFYELSRWMWLDQFRQDLRQALREMRRAPAFALTATLTLALGIGATTAIFTLIHAVLLKSLPVSRPEQLYGIGDTKHGTVYTGLADNWGIFSYDLYKHFRDNTAGFEQLAGMQADPRRIGVRRAGSPDPAESFYGEYISGNYFDTFGVPAFAGRTLGPADDRKSAPPVAMIAYRIWAQKYGLDPSVIGATFNLNGAPVTIVGVSPPGFFGDSLRANQPDFWMPLAIEPVVNRGGWVDNIDLHWLFVMGRIEPGADARQIEAQMRIQLRQWLTARVKALGREQLDQIPRQTLHLAPGGSGIGSLRDTYSSGLQLLMAISGFVLLIVCANLANLMLVRSLERRRQTSVRLALGAGRFRLVRQALTESLLLALIGGTAGVAIAFAGTRTLLAAVFTGGNAVPISPNPDLGVLLFAFGVSCLTGLIFGIAPAWTANHTDPVEALRGAGRSSTSSGSLPQRTLVVLQAALSLVLLASAGLLTQSLRNLENQKFGFDSDGRFAVRIDPNLAGYKIDQLEPLYHKIKDRLAQLPGVASVSYSLYSPMSGSSWSSQVVVDGHPPPARDDANVSNWNRAGPDYFDTIGTRILRGRPITDADTASTRHVAIVNQAFARYFFGNDDPIGKHFGVNSAKHAKDLEIVGIAEDTKYGQPEQLVPPMYFRPRSQMTTFAEPATLAFETRSLYANDIVLRLSGRDASIEARIRQAFAEIDPNLTVIRVVNFDKQIANNVNQPHLIARLTSLFGLTALLLATIGLYGVTAYTVQRRSKEMGIRIALGADRANVVSMVIRNAYLLVAIGLAIGLPLSLAMGRVLGTKLYGISGYNPVVLGGAVALLAAFALAAVIAPARRAASIDPIETLRSD